MAKAKAPGTEFRSKAPGTEFRSFGTLTAAAASAASTDAEVSRHCRDVREPVSAVIAIANRRKPLCSFSLLPCTEAAAEDRRIQDCIQDRVSAS